MTTLQCIREVLKDNEEYLKGFGFTEAGVFGSYVRGQETPESDVDILLGSANADIGWESAEIYVNLSKALHDTPVDIAMKHRLYPRLRDNILEEVEYVFGPPQTMAHNNHRDMASIMSRQRDYSIYLDRMLNIMKRAVESSQHLTYTEFKNDIAMVEASEMRLEKIGLAASRIPEHLTNRYSHLNIPWPEIVAMKDIDSYNIPSEMDYPRLWDTLTQRIPELFPRIQEMASSEAALWKKTQIVSYRH